MKIRRRPQGWPKGIHAMPLRHSVYNDNIYIDPVDKHLYDEPGEEEERMKINIQMREDKGDGHYKSMENKRTMV